MIKLVVASGHRTDDTDRASPRFPETSVPRVRQEIERQLRDWQIGRGDLLICGGAGGGDLLAAEAARACGADIRLLLALRPEDFVRSVAKPGTDWEKRFRSLANRADVRVYAGGARGGDLFAAAKRWMVDEAVQEPADERHALVVWDGQRGDRPGGTADFAAWARRAGIPVFGIDPTPRGSAERQWASGRKKLLALDGGGIRGILTLGILEAVEAELRAWAARPDLVLADYFDYIGGTSTGAIIATALSLGLPVKQIGERYRALGKRVFRFNWLTPFVALHPTAPLRQELEALIGHRRLGDPELRTLLLLVLHNSDTDSPWPVSNCPSARYNRPERQLSTHPDRGGDHEPDRNLELFVSDLVRGSTAAPLYFAPQDIRVGTRAIRFQDGGVTPYNNPALLLYSMATQREYQVRWPASEENLLLVSVGTGLAAVERARGWTWFTRVRRLPPVFMNGASIGQDYLCRVVGRTRFGFPIDNEVGMVPEGLRRFAYARYDVDIGKLADLRRRLERLNVSPAQIARLDDIEKVPVRKLARLDAIRQVERLSTLGALAGHLVDVERHFAGFPPS